MIAVVNDVRTIVVVSAGMGIPSATTKLAQRLSNAAATALEERGITAEVVFIEVRDLAHETVNAALTRVAGARLQEALDQIAKADAVIAVTPVWNGSYSGLFKLFFDVLDEGSLAGKPMILAATGGTVRHSLAIDSAMLPMFWSLKARPVPTPVFAATEDWGTASGLSTRVDQSATDLADALAGSPVAMPADPFEHVVAFDKLLASVRPRP